MEELKKFYIGMAIVAVIIIAIAVDQVLEFRWNEKNYKEMSPKRIKNVETIIAISIGTAISWWYVCSCFKHFDFVWLFLGIDLIAVIVFIFPIIIVNYKIDKQRGYGIFTAKDQAKQETLKNQKTKK